MAELPCDVVEQILVRLDVEDLIRCKSVCKSWQSFISSPRFVQAHLKHTYNNDCNNLEFGHRRICTEFTFLVGLSALEFPWLYNAMRMFVVGSCNGLVCVSPRQAKFVLINPSTREIKKLKTPFYHRPLNNRVSICWGFGYDSSTDDYKVVAGFRKDCSKMHIRFYVLTLKSNTWKVIGKVKYRGIKGIDGILCGGSLHWLMTYAKKTVILSLDLSTEEFKEIPQPDECEDQHKLGVIDGCLCIYSSWSPLSSRKWVMKNNHWELCNDLCDSKYDVAHCIATVSHMVDSRRKTTSYVYRLDDGKRVPSIGNCTRSSIFVRSLVSPHPNVNGDNTYEGGKRNAKEEHSRRMESHERLVSDAKGNRRKRKRNIERERGT